jgi:hypothetical protein
MKKLLFTLCLWLTVSWLCAQKKSNPQLFTGNAAVQEKSLEVDEEVRGAQVYFQIGNPLPYTYHEFADRNSISIRFPWDVPYIPLTFDELYFEVSKGYFSEKVHLSWTVQSNAAKIDQIKIYRRVFKETNINDKDNYAVIATLSSDSYSYDDTNTQGGVLYEYKVEAIGISSIPKKYVTYITGVGYRNPTGVVAGSVNYNGGSPVKDVVVRADPQGADQSFGSSLALTSSSLLSIPLRNKELSQAITLQAWVKLEAGRSASLFALTDNQRTTDEIHVSYTTTTNSLAVTVALTSGQSKTFTISNYYPTGNVDGRGDDLFNAFSNSVLPQSDFSQNFAHISIVLKNGEAPILYLNGRKINEAYVTSLPAASTTKPSVVTSGNYVFGGFQTAEVTVAQGLRGNLDEIRLWNTALEEKRIRTDFKRYLGGSETNLISYLRCDEKAGKFAYDISKVGFEFNKNHARIINGTWSIDKPTASQLGILGVTDVLGNYIISAIPFSGTGESYTITPMYGVHQFEPSQQLVFIGNGSEVINKVDFKDISSFDFLGVVSYTTQGVFDPIAPVSNVVNVIEDGYNQYRAIINGNEQLISKGSYYYDKTNLLNPVLYETPNVFVAGANIYIDGDIVLDKDKRPVVSDEQGFFKIKVPIGEHYIEVRKDKHGFRHKGRFPAARQDGKDMFEFFEHQQSAITFLDTTRVSLVGRVVGGTHEAEKPIGFGYAAPLKETYHPGTPEQEVKDISSINNIGIATITLSYLPFGGTPGIGELKHSFTTNDKTGEYKVSLLPLSYTIDQSTGLRINSNTGIKLLTANETVNISDAKDPVTSSYENAAGALVYSQPYHFIKSFTYRSTPVLNVISQSSDTEVLVKTKDSNGVPKEITVNTDGFAYPVYTQGLSYAIVFETFEEYLNKDEADVKVDQVPIVDGEFNITNNLALANSQKITVDEKTPSISKYIFRGGLPSIAPPFTRTIDIKYRVDGRDYDARNYKTQGIILGGQSDGSQTFVTEAPDMPDIILRDPPGSNSFASIEKGRTISFTEEGSFSVGQSAAYGIEMKLGTKFAAGGGIAGPIIEAEAVNSITAGLSLAVESTNGKSITKTYTFNQTISTSDDPSYVGSEGDLYIGNTKNYFYGSYDNIQANKEQLGTSPSLVLTNTTGESINVSKQKAFYFAEEPSETFFIYSQKYILETLIPELEGIIEGIELGTILESTPGVLKKSQYQEQVRLWKKVIQDNEQTKFLALRDRDNYKAQIKTNLEKEIAELNAHITAIEAMGGVATVPGLTQIGIQSLVEATGLLEDKKQIVKDKLALLESQFLQNISFDAGVGEFTKSSEISVAQQKNRSVKLDFDVSLETTFGFKLNETGLLLHTNNSLNTSINSALTEEESENTVVSYTLKDNDSNNFLSVDVINTFDGNGPIFSTIGGRTSCPYEGIDNTIFYNNAAYKSEARTLGLTGYEDSGTIYSGGDQISYATQKIESPGISVAVASVTDVPEERAAEFKLILENNSVAHADANFLLYVDNTTNPNNAIINIEQNGTVVFVPYGSKVEYAVTLKKSISDVYEYKNIDIVLASLCDGSLINQKVTISAVFRPSCTAVMIDNPLTNWVFNAGDAYNIDNTTNPLNVSMFGYNRAFNSFQNFRLEYRKATSSSWTRLKTYYNTQALLDAAVLQGEDQGVLISANTTNFAWDIGKLGLSDGQYELRAMSTCSNGTTFISDVVKGTVDLNVPVQFGTPTPTDGILGPGEDLRLQFNENIFYSSALSKIQIQGETNQQDIDHNVSIHFEGAANTLTIEKPNILPGDFSIEFWMQNQTIGTGILFDQADALRVALNNGIMQWTLGTQTLSKAIAKDIGFHHYTLTYNASNKTMKMYQDDQEIGSLQNANGLVQRSENPLTIGGNTFIGNMHELRFWSKPLTLSEAYAAQFNELIGSERDLVGYWPMDEGTGAYASDKARFKHAAINAAWDIKPKGTAYDFKSGQYLVMDDVNFVQLTNQMDVTLCFWMKTDQMRKATIFSNGRGNGEDIIQSNGKANKWSVALENGILSLNNEGIQYKLSTTNLADNSWHHVAIVLRRTGSLKTYIDAGLESSNPITKISGISGNKFWIGARGFINTALQESVDEVFTGKIDELRLWNMARATEQISRDRFNEVDFNATGLMLYARMNVPDPVTAKGPQYYHKAANETMLPSNAKMNVGSVSYTSDAPKIKQVRPYLTFQVSHVINGDEMILTPLVSDWSVLEGQIIDITVDRMFDVYGNRQSSPITWSAYVRRNEVTWFAGENAQTLAIEKTVGDPYNFDITIINKGGKKQPYAIENIPQWLTASNTKGTLDPNSVKVIRFKIAPELSIGEYSQDLYLNTDFNFDEKILLNIRVLGKAPDWKIDPSAFEISMSIIGKVKINGTFSQDAYSKVAAFIGDQVRGVANLEYDKNYDEYFVYLNVFSNTSSGEEITFKIWDASTGKIFQATMDGALSFTFIQNEVIGFKTKPVIFESTRYIDQVLTLNKGWTWISIYAKDTDLGNLNRLTSPMALTNNDIIKSQVYFDMYDNQTGWDGSLTTSGGLSPSTMYKMKLAKANNLTLGGDEVDIAGWSTHINAGWNWLAYPLSNNINVNEALALLEPKEGDVIKNQRAFAIYDPIVGWSGPLGYMVAGEGYMLKASKAQEFNYPDIFKSTRKGGRLNENTNAGIDDWATYEYTMSIVAEVVAEETYDTVWVFDHKGTLRGKSAIVENGGRRLSYITVFGNSEPEDNLVFYLGNGNYREATSQGFFFTPDLLMGTMNKPVILNGTENLFTVYPNAFTSALHLTFNAMHAQETEIVLLDVLGHDVYRHSHTVVKGSNEIRLEPNVPNGLYLLTTTIDGSKHTLKVIKK